MAKKEMTSLSPILAPRSNLIHTRPTQAASFFFSENIILKMENRTRALKFKKVSRQSEWR